MQVTWVKTLYRPFPSCPKGARDGVVVRVLASHQCGPGSNPGVDAICGLTLLLVLSFAPRGFSLGNQAGIIRRRTSKSLFIYIYLFKPLFQVRNYWQWNVILMQMKLIFKREVLHLASLLKWEVLELGNGSNGLFSGAWISPIMQLTLIEDVDHYMGNRGGAVVKALTSHQCSPQSHLQCTLWSRLWIPEATPHLGLFFCVIALALTGFSSGAPVFSPP